jgi:hypothetical protein
VLTHPKDSRYLKATSVDLPQIHGGPQIPSETNLWASLNLRDEKELLNLAFDFMRKPCSI